MSTKHKTYELPLIITRNQVYFPHNQSDDLDAGRPQTVDAIRFANSTDEKLVIVATQRVFTINNPELEDVYAYGVLAKLTKVRERPHHVTVQLEPLARVLIETVNTSGSYTSATAFVVPHLPLDPNVDQTALKAAIYKFFRDKLELTRRLHISIDDVESADMSLEELIYFLANKTLNSTEQRMQILEESSLEKRIELLLKMLEEDAKNDTVMALTQIVRNRPQSGSDNLEETIEEADIVEA